MLCLIVYILSVDGLSMGSQCTSFKFKNVKKSKSYFVKHFDRCSRMEKLNVESLDEQQIKNVVEAFILDVVVTGSKLNKMFVIQ